MGREGEIKCRYRRLRHAISASSMPNAPHGCSHFRSEWMLKGVDVSKVWSWKSKVRVLRRAWRKAVSQSETSSQTSATLGCISSSTTPLVLQRCLILLVQMQYFPYTLKSNVYCHVVVLIVLFLCYSSLVAADDTRQYTGKQLRLPNKYIMETSLCAR